MRFFRNLFGGGIKKNLALFEKEVDEIVQQGASAEVLDDAGINALEGQLDPLLRQEQYRQAIAVATQVCYQTRQLLGRYSHHYASRLCNLAGLHALIRSYEKAETLYLQANVILVKAGIDKVAEQFVTCGNGMGSVSSSLGKYDEAEQTYTLILEAARKYLGEEHHGYVEGLNGLAVVYHAVGNYAGAELLLRRALEIERKISEDDAYLAQIMKNLAVACKAVGKYAEAEQLYKQALNLFRKALGERDDMVAQTLERLAELYEAMGDPKTAELFMRQALAIWHKKGQ